MDTSANIVTWYAAIAATVAVIISVWVAWRERTRIVVTGLSGYRVIPGEPYDPEKTFLVITVSNPSRRSRTITNVGVNVRDRSSSKSVLAADKGPQVLAEGESSFWVMEYGGESKLTLESIKDVWATDQSGKIYRGKFQRIAE
jgi:hypothetical protein